MARSLISTVKNEVNLPVLKIGRRSVKSASTPSGAFGASVTLVDNGVFANLVSIPGKKNLPGNALAACEIRFALALSY
jgi:hypothetical protein